ncbi:hypothetical protein [Pseudodesulfovibrio sp. zrk46]|uniref:hypothetical protein n=1 Tax=Pseudodesulfovibrio sp. zrk46 TaxID=2725288 RepID=UPI001449EFDD|nr:hypothetical protein [Pseudodesulfovibrio sp. zrk46]QJB55677.1 hypothetical protein HFN16_04360 [Pseudodesulfovibrio sp. zrk46]
MRFKNIQRMAAAKDTMPFAGLGFSMDTVRDAADSMTITYLGFEGWRYIEMPVPGVTRQLSGYSLLVALGREIRGR